MGLIIRFNFIKIQFNSFTNQNFFFTNCLSLSGPHLLIMGREKFAKTQNHVLSNLKELRSFGSFI